MKPTQNNRPYAVYIVDDRGEGSKSFWTKVGSAWPNGDGKGFNVQLTALPLDGRLVIRAPKNEAEAGQ
jgi:hypothetical protein